MRSSVFTICMIIFLLGVLTLLSCRAEGSAKMTINISSNGRHFVDGNGKPLFWQGDTEWELFHLLSLERHLAHAFFVLREKDLLYDGGISVSLFGRLPGWFFFHTRFRRFIFQSHYAPVRGLGPAVNLGGSGPAENDDLLAELLFGGGCQAGAEQVNTDHFVPG